MRSRAQPVLCSSRRRRHFGVSMPLTACLRRTFSRTIELPASLRSDGIRDHPGMLFGFPSEQAVQLRPTANVRRSWSVLGPPEKRPDRLRVHPQRHVGPAIPPAGILTRKNAVMRGRYPRANAPKSAREPCDHGLSADDGVPTLASPTAEIAGCQGIFRVVKTGPLLVRFWSATKFFSRNFAVRIGRFWS